jgi:hypothetical protein
MNKDNLIEYLKILKDCIDDLEATDRTDLLNEEVAYFRLILKICFKKVQKRYE